MEDYTELSRIVAESDKKDKEKRFYSDLYHKCDRILLQIADPDFPATGSNPLELLANTCIEGFKRIELYTEQKTPPSLEEKREKAAAWASNTILRDNSFYITIFLGGEIPYELKLKDYLPWKLDSDYFMLFLEEFNRRNS